MSLFNGQACFSPSVSSSVLDAWVAHGGTVTQSSVRQDEQRPQFYFCNGTQDPWLSRLLERSITVFHSSWIAKAAATNFLIPIAKYVLDDRYEAREPTIQHDLSSKTTPLTAEAHGAGEHQTRGGTGAKRSRPTDDECPSSDHRPAKKARTTKLQSEDTRPRIVIKNVNNTSLGNATKSSKVPRLDLRKLATRPRKTETFVIKKVPARPQRTRVSGFLLDPGLGAPPRISVADALHALRGVQTSNAARFKPGSEHLGKEFHCAYAGDAT